jgi:anti-anti-sigma regulatory factor
MLALNVWRIGKVAIIHCEGRIVRSDAAFQLRDAVAQQKGSRVVLLDLSGVQALEGGGLGMLIFLQLWTHDRGIQLKVFDPVAGVRRSLERTRSTTVAVEIAGLGEVLSLLVSALEELLDRTQRAA